MRASVEAARTHATKLRKAEEERLTNMILGDVQQQMIEDATIIAGGRVKLGDEVFQIQDRGSQFGGHSNLCGYLSLTSGDGHAAVNLKQELAPYANQFAREVGDRVVDFGGLDTCIDLDVIRMYVLHKNTPVCVYSVDAAGVKGIGVATVYWTDACLGFPRKTIYLSGVHYQELIPVGR